MTNEEYRRWQNLAKQNIEFFNSSKFFEYAGGDKELAFNHVRGLRTLTALHEHDFYELSLVVDGSGIYGNKKNQVRIVAGDFFITPPRVQHRYFDQDKLDIINLLWYPERLPFRIPLLDRLIFAGNSEAAAAGNGGHFAVTPIRHLTPDQLEEALSYFHRLAEEFRLHLCCMRENMLLIFYEMMIYLTRICGSERKSADNNMIINRRIEQVISFLQHNFAKPIGRIDAAEIFRASESTFARIFRKVVGETFVNYLQNLRLHHAKMLLEITDCDIEEITEKCGFSSSSYLIYQFRRKFGVTCYRYRRDFMKNAQPERKEYFV